MRHKINPLDTLKMTEKQINLRIYNYFISFSLLKLFIYFVGFKIFSKVSSK